MEPTNELPENVQDDGADEARDGAAHDGEDDVEDAHN